MHRRPPSPRYVRAERPAAPGLRDQRGFAKTPPLRLLFRRCFRLALLAFSLLQPNSAIVAQDDSSPKIPPAFRQIRGKHLTLITDLPASPAIDAIPEAFSQAVPQWCDYFGVPRERVAKWHVRGYLMAQPERFRTQGLLPNDLPPFLHGYQRGYEFWLNEQPSDYFRRHLVLHEGTHAFMNTVMRSRIQPGWYFEGVAELLATHRYEDGNLQLNVIPRAKEDVPEWGRIRLIRDAVAAGRPQSLNDLRQLSGRDFQSVDAYAWSWAAAAFLDGHPAWRETYRSWAHLLDRDTAAFEAAVTRALGGQAAENLEIAWQLFLQHLDYGYLVAEDQVHTRPSAFLRGPQSVAVDSRRGWQSSGWILQQGQRYRVEASGRYLLDRANQRWSAEAGGVTIRYHHGKPLGILLAAVQPEPGTSGAGNAFLTPLAAGTACEFVPQQTGTLYFRVNEMAGELGNNEGTLMVRVMHAP